MAPPKPPTCPALPCRRLCPSPTRGWRRRSTTTTPSAPSSGGWGRVLRHKQFPESCTACLRWEKCQHPHFPPPTPLLPACLPPKPAPRSIRCFLPACLLQPTNQQTNPTPPSALAAGTWAWSRTSWVRASWTPCCSSPSRWVLPAFMLVYRLWGREGGRERGGCAGEWVVCALPGRGNRGLSAAVCRRGGRVCSQWVLAVCARSC